MPLPKEISDKMDVEFTKEKNTPLDKEQEAAGIPTFMENIDLTDEQEKRLVKEIFDELEAIEKERDEDHLDERFEALENQYNGKLREDKRRQFKINRKVTKIKVDRVKSLMCQAFLKIDPMFSVTPRPEFARRDINNVCDKQQDYVDYKLDNNMSFEDAFRLWVHSTVVKGLGFLKVEWDVQTTRRKREERYKGNPVVEINPETGDAILDVNGKPVIRNGPLEEFISNWPSAMQSNPGYIRALMEGKEINFLVEYTDVIYNDIRFSFVQPEKLFFRVNTEGYQGLCSTRLIVESEEYSWWKLKQYEKAKKFHDVDELKYQGNDESKKEIKGYEQLNYEILTCTYFFKLDESDDDGDEVKLVVYIGRERKKIIGASYYGYYGIDCVYLPMNINKINKTLYNPGLAEDLKDTNIAENALINFILEGAWMRNMVTPIAPEGSEIHAQFGEKRWTHGVPMVANTKEIDFLQRYMPAMDIGGLLTMFQYLIQTDDEVSRVTSLMTGKESPLDPTAPASKTFELLRQSGIGIEEFINTALPSVNLIPGIMLQLYHQMSREPGKYRINPDRVVGENAFSEISREDMAAKTNIQSRAHAFDPDKLNENKMDVALFNLLRMEPILAQNPNAIYLMIKNIVKSWSPKWKSLVDQLLPPLEEFKKSQIQMALKALAMYIQEKQKEATVTGVKPEYVAEEFIPFMQGLVSQIATPLPEEVAKEQEKA